MARKLVPKRYKLACQHNGELVRYIDKYDFELAPEIDRLSGVIAKCILLSERCRRLHHPNVKTAAVQLKLISPQPQHPDLAAEICRINCALFDVLGLLNEVSNSKLPCLQDLRFALTYGQTHRKRDRKGFKDDAQAEYANECKHHDDDEEGDPEGC